MKRNKFSLSHYKLLTMDMGDLIPITWYEALPGDSIQQATSALIRVSPLLAPVMHPVTVRLHHWFVPNRIIWEDWEDFITGGPLGTSTPTHPYRSTANSSAGNIFDYLGIFPSAYSPNLNFSALPLRAYQLIWNEHYRDQDLSSEATIDLTDGLDTTTSNSIQKVAWEKDYFTTSRPWEQKGTAPTIPLGTSAPIKTDALKANSDGLFVKDGNDADAVLYGNSSSGYEVQLSNTFSPDEALYADLSSATGIDINDLRLALSLQRYQEARARYGSRYVEYLRYLGVRSSDARLQRPEYLGGGRQVIQFSEVLSTDGSNTGDLKGHGIAALKTNRYRRFFEEHGIVMTLMSVIPKTIYNSSMTRNFLRTTKEDYFQKELQFIGDQEITNQEVHPPHATPSGVFGYQARYDEYRHHPSSIAGEFRNTLDHWHYSRIFATDPALNSSFVEATPTKRVNASTSTDCLYVMANHSIQARRMLAGKGTGRTI